MIAVTREGAPISAAEYTDEQREQLWVQVFRAFLLTHPEELNTGGHGETEAAHPQS